MGTRAPTVRSPRTELKMSSPSVPPISGLHESDYGRRSTSVNCQSRTAPSLITPAVEQGSFLSMPSRLARELLNQAAFIARIENIVRHLNQRIGASIVLEIFRSAPRRASFLRSKIEVPRCSDASKGGSSPCSPVKNGLHVAAVLVENLIKARAFLRKEQIGAI